jgi:cell division protein FtsW (lipid II flippase)
VTSAPRSEGRRLLGVALIAIVFVFVFQVVVVLMPVPLLFFFLLVVVIVFRIFGEYVKGGSRRIKFGKCVSS